MRRVIAAAFVSLDGVMQAPGGPPEDPTGGFAHGGWVAGAFDEEIGRTIGELFARPFDLLLGRKTYDIFAAHWPYAPEGDPIGSLFDRITKFVATRNASFSPSWQNSRVLGPDAAAAVRRLKTEDGPDLLTQGSSDFLQTLLRDGLVDEFHVWTFPVILGGGKRLFGEGVEAQGLKLTGSRITSGGTVSATYVPAGEVRIGDFSQAEPSAAELERRRNLA